MMKCPSSKAVPAAVILDFDGVVVDSLAAHLEAWEQAARQLFGKAIADPEALARLSTRAIAGILAKRFGDSSQASTLADVKERLLVEGAVPVPLMPGAAAFVASVRGQGIPLGIASNSRRAYVHALVRGHGLAVETVVCGDDVRHGKPRPDIFWECANRLGVDHRERPRVLVYEDSLHGIEAALAAGMRAIGITSVETAEALRAAGATDAYANLGEAIVSV